MMFFVLIKKFATFAMFIPGNLWRNPSYRVLFFDQARASAGELQLYVQGGRRFPFPPQLEGRAEIQL